VIILVTKVTSRRQKFRQNQNNKTTTADPDHGQGDDFGDNFYTLKQKGRQSAIRIHKMKVKTV
jgi:hypothetical protein